MPISEIERKKAERALRAYCARKTNPAVADQLEIVCRFEGNHAFIAERRPDWMNPQAGSIDYDIAKFRFLVKDRRWRLYWLDRNLRWHLYQSIEPSREIEGLLSEVDADPIFFG